VPTRSTRQHAARCTTTRSDLQISQLGLPERLVDLKNGTPTSLNGADNTYNRPLTILAQGEWTQYYVAENPNNPPRCSGPIAAALTFRNAEKEFHITDDAG
jgi:hypothetical protein